MGKTTIEWADKTLNFYDWKCNKVSPGCQNCYMMSMAERFGKKPHGTPNWRGASALKEYRALKAGDVVFVNSMSDTYHEGVAVEHIHAIHNMATAKPDVTFLILTKRVERAYYLSPYLVYPENLWIGTSVESRDYLWRLDYLLRIPAAGHFLSAEPLLDYLTIELTKYVNPFLVQHHGYQKPLGWVIVGGESGKNRRPFFKSYAQEIRNICQTYHVPFLFKQGGAFKSGQDRELDGRTWDESPFWKSETNYVNQSTAG